VLKKSEEMREAYKGERIKLVEGEFLQNIVSSMLDLELKIHVLQARHHDECF